MRAVWIVALCASWWVSEARADDRACVSNDECVVSCDDDCCPGCGCSNVVNRAAAERFRRERPGRCTREVVRQCQPVACRMDITLQVPVCEDGRCKLLGSRFNTYPLPAPEIPPPPAQPPPQPPPPVEPPPKPAPPVLEAPRRQVFTTPQPTPMPKFPKPKNDAPPELRCETDADCELSCEGCCGAPCGCSNAVDRATAAKARKTKAARCRNHKPGSCPAVGCVHEYYSATCDAGRCRALKGLGAVFGDEPRVDPRLPSGHTTLEGVRIEFPVQRTTFTRAQLKRGVRLRWNLVVARGPGGEVVPDPVQNGCATAGPTGLTVQAIITNGTQRYCLCDVGLCVPQSAKGPLKQGEQAGSITWDGSTWSGPSDTNLPKGPPFTPGRATLVVSSSGTFDGQRIRVEATLPVTITP